MTDALRALLVNPFLPASPLPDDANLATSCEVVPLFPACASSPGNSASEDVPSGSHAPEQESVRSISADEMVAGLRVVAALSHDPVGFNKALDEYSAVMEGRG